MLNRLPIDVLQLVAAHFTAEECWVARATCKALRQSIPAPPAGEKLRLRSDSSAKLAEYVVETCQLERAPAPGDLARLGLLGRLKRIGVHSLREAGDGKDLCSAAAGGGRLGVLFWATNESFRCGGGAAAAAAAGGGHSAALYWLLEYFDADDRAVVAAAARGDIDHVRRMRLGYGLPLTAEAAAAAASGGHARMLEWMLDNGCVADASVMAGAATRGDVDMLAMLHEERGCPWDETACASASAAGHTHALKWMLKRGCPRDFRTVEGAFYKRPFDGALLSWLLDHQGIQASPASVLSMAVVSGCTEAVDWAVGRGSPLRGKLYLMGDDTRHTMLRHLAMLGCPWEGGGAAILNVAATGDTAVAELALRAGCPWMPAAVSVAAVTGGNLSFFDWAAMRRGLELPPGVGTSLASSGDAGRVAWLLARGHEWVAEMPAVAAQAGHPTFVRWAVRQGCPVGVGTVFGLAGRGDVCTLAWLDCAETRTRWDSQQAKPGHRVWSWNTIIKALPHPHTIEYMVRTGDISTELDGRLMGAAAAACNSESLFILIDVVVKSHKATENMLTRVTTELAGAGDKETLKRAVAAGCPVDSLAAVHAAGNGKHDTLRWLYGQGCALDARVCAHLAQRGEKEELARARAEGCPWDEGTFRGACKAAAVKPECIDTLKYVMEMGCPRSADPWMAAVECGRPEQLDMLLQGQRRDKNTLRLVEKTIARRAPHAREGMLTRVLLRHADGCLPGALNVGPRKQSCDFPKDFGSVALVG